MRHNSEDVVIDKGLTDTALCRVDGHLQTMRLYSELHRVLKPGGRLFTISLHSEDEALPFGRNNPACLLIASSCTLESSRKEEFLHSFCVFDKEEGLGAGIRFQSFN